MFCLLQQTAGLLNTEIKSVIMFLRPLSLLDFHSNIFLMTFDHLVVQKYSRKQTGYISTVDGTSLKLVDKFPYLGSSVSSTEKDIDTRLTKARKVIDRLSIIWKSDLIAKMKRSFFQAAVLSILLYGGTTWTLSKRLEKKLDGNDTRMLRAILNKSWRQHPTRHQQTATYLPSRKLSKLEEPDMQDTAAEAGTSSSVMYSFPHMAGQRQDDQLEHT